MTSQVESLTSEYDPRTKDLILVSLYIYFCKEVNSLFCYTYYTNGVDINVWLIKRGWWNKTERRYMPSANISLCMGPSFDNNTTMKA